MGALEAPTTAAADTSIATVLRATSVSAHKDQLVWSTYDPVTGNYSLSRLADGVASTVPVPPRAVPFDVDLGPGPTGATLATYSRCKEEPSRVGPDGLPYYQLGRGCDIFAFDFAAGREFKVRGASTRRGSEYLPTVWARVTGSQVAFARSYPRRPGRRGRLPRLYVRGLETSARSRRLRAGPLGASPGPFVSNFDLRERRLVFLWRYYRKPADDPSIVTRPAVFQVRLATTTKGIRRVIAERQVGEEDALNIRILLSPAIATNRVYFMYFQEGEDDLSWFFRYSISNAETEAATSDTRPPAISLAVDRRLTQTASSDLLYYVQPNPARPIIGIKQRFDILRAEMSALFSSPPGGVFTGEPGCERRTTFRKRDVWKRGHFNASPGLRFGGRP
jgi:hypothetical protein